MEKEQYVTENELHGILSLILTLNDEENKDVFEEVSFETQVYDSNGESIGTIGVMRGKYVYVPVALADE